MAEKEKITPQEHLKSRVQAAKKADYLLNAMYPFTFLLGSALLSSSSSLLV